MSFKSFMDEALKEARKAETIDEVPIGAVVVDAKTNKIIARAHNKNISKKDSTAHAEILVIQKACRALKSHRLENCDLYVTLEPCAMCAGAISLSRIRRVYFGVEDKKSGAVYNGAKVFGSSSCHHRPEVYGEIHVDECEGILKDFFKNKR